MNQGVYRFVIKALNALNVNLNTCLISFFPPLIDFRGNIILFATKLNVNIPDVKDLLAAFTHESYLIANADKLMEPYECNEKLAFLGKT